MEEKDKKDQTCCGNSDTTSTSSNDCSGDTSPCCGNPKRSICKTIVFAVIILAAIGLGAYKVINNEASVDPIYKASDGDSTHAVSCAPGCKTKDKSCCKK